MQMSKFSNKLIFQICFLTISQFTHSKVIQADSSQFQLSSWSFAPITVKKGFIFVRKMKLLSVVKGTLSKFKKSEDSSADNDEVPEDFHRTPAGEYPRNGPKSGIVAIVMFYLSKIITLVGFIMVARAVWFEEVRIVIDICEVFLPFFLNKDFLFFTKKQ